jgi:hypothetical protein
MRISSVCDLLSAVYPPCIHRVSYCVYTVYPLCLHVEKKFVLFHEKMHGSLGCKKECGTSCPRCWRNKLKHGNIQSKAWLKKHPEQGYFVEEAEEGSFVKVNKITDYGTFQRRKERFEKKLAMHPGWAMFSRKFRDAQERYDKWRKDVGEDRIPTNRDLWYLFSMSAYLYR